MGTGKFFPGSNKRDKAKETKEEHPEPIRAEEPNQRQPGLFPGAKSRFSKQSDSKMNPGLLIVSIILCVTIISVAWYFLAVRPIKMQNRAIAAQLAQREKELKELQQKQEELVKKQQETPKVAARATVIVGTKPVGCSIAVGSVTKIAPATFEGVIAGKVTMAVSHEGYRSQSRELSLDAGQTYDLGIVELVRKTGTLQVTSPQRGVFYTLTNPDFSLSGTLGAVVDTPAAGSPSLDPLAQPYALSEGVYVLTAVHKGWKLPPVTVTISDGKSVVQELKYPYATITLQSDPPGAIVRRGRQEIARTPTTLSEQRPGKYAFVIEKEGYRTARPEVEVKDFETKPLAITLEKTRDFTNSANMSLIWMNDGYWVGKYEVTQAQYEQVMGREANASVFRGANHPVENISWQQAVDFCARLTDVDQAAGKLPSGYRYALPTEAQWNVYVGDSDYENSILALGSNSVPASTAEVGSMEPNQYGLYDVLGNVWEWCQDNYDAQGRARVMRGGGWLSSRSAFPNKGTRYGGGVDYHDKFTGFRVVLVK